MDVRVKVLAVTGQKIKVAYCQDSGLCQNCASIGYCRSSATSRFFSFRSPDSSFFIETDVSCVPGDILSVELRSTFLLSRLFFVLVVPTILMILMAIALQGHQPEWAVFLFSALTFVGGWALVRSLLRYYQWDVSYYSVKVLKPSCLPNLPEDF